MRSEDLIEPVLRTARDARVEFVHLQFIDIPGTIKGLSVPADRLEASLTDGVWFDGSSVEGLARIAESDLYLRPDPSTFSLVTWEKPPTARLICNLETPSGQPFPADPRFVLRRALADAADLGFTYHVGAEVEFYLFEEGASEGQEQRPSGAARPLVPADTRSYFELLDDRAAGLCQRAVNVLRQMGYRVAATHHETSPGQHEIDLDEDEALRTADAIVTLKLVVRALSREAGLFPTFMPKPVEHASGSGLHLSQVLRDSVSARGLLFDPATGEPSPIGQHFIAGQLGHARGLCAILAPLVNSYKRLLGGAEAPAAVSWARVSRGAFLRVPSVPGPGPAALEARAADPSCNPYLTLAVLLQAGLDGIRERTPLSAPDEQTPTLLPAADETPSPPLPSTLGEALEELGWDMVVRSALGQPVFERFLAAKEREWLAYRHHISSWELDAYLESA